MNEIIRYEIDGRTLEGRKVGEQVWFAAERVAQLLAYEDKDGVLKLYERHQDEFLSHESTTVRLTAVDGKRRVQRVFSFAGIDHLAILAKTEVGVRVRRALVDLQQGVRDGSLAVATRAQVEALTAALAKLERRLGNVEADKQAHKRLGKEIGSQISAAFRAQRRAKEIDREAEVFEQGRLLGLVERRLSRSEERVLAAIAAAGGFDSVRALATQIKQPLGATGEDVGALATRGLVQRVEGRIQITPQPPANSTAHPQ